jgi:hypothetical protein
MTQRQQLIHGTIVVLAMAAFGLWGWLRWQRAGAPPAASDPVTLPLPAGGPSWMTEEKLSPHDRREALRAAGEPMAQILDEFFALSPKEQREFLDRQIDQARTIERNLAPGRPPGLPPGEAGGETQVLAFGPQDHLDATTPERRAKEQEYFRRLRERKKERGIEDDGTLLMVRP